MLECYNTTLKKNKKVLLKNINLQIHENEIIGLIGPNGSGKSTLLKILAGIEKPSSGSVSYNKENTIYNLKKGFFIESGYFIRYLTGRQFLECFLIQMGNTSKSEIARIIEEYTEITKIIDFLDIKINKYSQGMLQRLGVCCSIIHSPTFILLDEPTNFLDAESKIIFKNIIKFLKKREVTVIITSHNLEEVNDYCNRVCLMNNGTIVKEINTRSSKGDIYSVLIKGEIGDKLNSININFSEHVENDVMRVEVYHESLNLILDFCMRTNLEIIDISKQNILEIYIDRA